MVMFFFSSRRRHTSCALVTGVQTCALPILPYDPATQFAPISRVASTVFVVVVHPSLPVKSMADLIALAKRRPGTLTFGSAGNGAAGQIGRASCRERVCQ